MYIDNSGYTYYSGCTQHHSRAPFLILMQDEAQPTSAPIRAIVRKVALQQAGHWMFGYANIGGKWVYVCGSYGADGLTLSVDTATFNRGTTLPDNLRDAWNTGGGWNGCGNEAGLMAEFAKTI